MLKVIDVTKKYGDYYALNHLELTINRGEVYGFVGPNGAGKTTTMKLITGLLKPTSGELLIEDQNIIKYPQEVKRKIGYMPDFFGIYDNLKVMEYMEFYASIYGLDGRKATQRCGELLDLVNLHQKSEEYVDGLSRGMKQRLCLARCLIHDPELLILDEPASGLDPRARVEMKSILRNLKTMGKTILISSHILPELAEICTNIGIIDQGKMVLSGTVDSILHNFNESNPLIIRFTNHMDKGLEVLKKNPCVSHLSNLDDQVSVGFAGNQQAEAMLLSELIQSGAQVNYFAREEGNLEELFMKITREGEERHAMESSISKRT